MPALHLQVRHLFFNSLSLCGVKPRAGLIENFLEQKLVRVTIPHVQVSQPPDEPPEPTAKPVSFTFNSETHPVRTWKDVLVKLCELIKIRSGDEFETKVILITGTKRPYFSREKNELFRPMEIKGSPIYVETNFSKNSIKSVCDKLIALFGQVDAFNINER